MRPARPNSLEALTRQFAGLVPVKIMSPLTSECATWSEGRANGLPVEPSTRAKFPRFGCPETSQFLWRDYGLGTALGLCGRGLASYLRAMKTKDMEVIPGISPHTLRIDEIRAGGEGSIEAAAPERAVVAELLDLSDLSRLALTYSLHRLGQGRLGL